MAGDIKISLKAGDRIHVNGAVIRVDRRVTLALETEATFLLASHVLADADAMTPLQKHYCAVQALLIEPQRQAELLEIYRASHRLVSAVHGESTLGEKLAEVDAAIRVGRTFEALRKLRALIDGETAAAAISGYCEASALPSSPIEAAPPTPQTQPLTESAGPRVPSACRRSRRSRQA